MGELKDYYAAQDAGRVLDDDFSVRPTVGDVQALELMRVLMRTARVLFSKDPSTPSLTLSELGAGEYYGSIARYEKPYGEGKLVVCKARSSMLAGVLSSLSEQLSALVQEDKRHELLLAMADLAAAMSREGRF